jgi:hypothetical protein
MGIVPSVTCLWAGHPRNSSERVWKGMARVMVFASHDRRAVHRDGLGVKPLGAGAGVGIVSDSCKEQSRRRKQKHPALGNGQVGGSGPGWTFYHGRMDPNPACAEGRCRPSNGPHIPA